MRYACALTVVMILGLASSACVTSGGGQSLNIAPGERPAVSTDEAGLWMAMDKVEDRLKTSGRVIAEEPLKGYVSGLVCKLAGTHCPDIRVYVVRTPHFNASMAPNGFMQVWTGLILRAQNEAQLAYVLGHELGHYVQRHSLKLWRDVRAKTNVLVFFQALAAAAGAGYVGNVAQLVTYASIFGHSRDNEREADRIGFELVVNAGYDPREAAKIWESLIAERNVTDNPKQLIFFSTHPPTEDRVDTLKSLANETVDDSAPGETGRDRFLSATLPFRTKLLRDELRHSQFKRTQVVLDHLFEGGAKPGELHFFQGELYRLRGQEGDSEQAVEAYETALATGDAPPECLRSLGLVLAKSGQNDRAREALSDYLSEAPAADDRAMVEAYIKRLE